MIGRCLAFRIALERALADFLDSRHRCSFRFQEKGRLQLIPVQDQRSLSLWPIRLLSVCDLR